MLYPYAKVVPAHIELSNDGQDDVVSRLINTYIRSHF